MAITYRPRLLYFLAYSALVISGALSFSCSGGDSPERPRSARETSDEKPVDNVSQSRRVAVPKSEIDSDRKVALLMGNSKYRGSSNIAPLKNPVNDAKAMAKVLKGLGFEVILKLDLTRDETLQVLDEFHKEIVDGAAVTLFYYSGHGLQYKGENYIIPVTSLIESNSHIERYGVNFQELIAKLEDAETHTNILIFDACRNILQFQQSRGVSASSSAGLAEISAPGGTYIVYSTSPGEYALDGVGDHSPFTEELLRWIKEPGLTIEQVFKRVRRDVLRKTDNEQQPWDSSSLTEEFYFMPLEDSEAPVVANDNFDEAFKYFTAAMELSEKQRYDEAIGMFSKVIEISPEFAEAYKERGTIYIKKKDFNESIDDLDKAIELKPDFAAAYNNRGIVYSILGEHETALADFDKALEIDAGFLKSYNNKARLFQLRGDHDEAFKVYARALEINPNYAPAYNNRGLLHFKRKEYPKAVEDYSRAIENDSRYADAYHNRGVAYYYMNMNEEALEDYNAAILINPKSFEAYRDRAYLYEEMGRPDKAKMDRETALELSQKQ